MQFRTIVKNSMNITVIQFRTDISGPHEVKCLYNVLGVSYEKLTFINALNGGFASHIATLKKSTDLWILAGWGEAGYESTDPFWIEKLNIVKKRMHPLIRKLNKEQVPLIGICFGFQLMVDALGGRLEVDPHTSEGGIYPISLTQEGKKEPIFMGMKNEFAAVLGHKTSIAQLPEGAIRLAYSKKCHIQAARFNSHSFGFTFHPELSHADLVERIALYKDYVSNKKDMAYQEVATSVILKNIVKKCTEKYDRLKPSSKFSSKSL